MSIGDEVLEIDGLATFSLLPTILKYSSMARDLSNQHLLAYVLSRPSYMTDLVPTAKTARLKAKTAAGEIITVDLPWEAVAYNKDLQRLIPNQMPFDLHVPFADELNSVVDGHIGQMGQTEPFFLTSTTQSQFKFVRVYPSDAARKKFGLKDTEKPDIYAALYKYQGKTIFLVRQATYAPSGFTSPIYLKAYQALFYEYQDLADVMVLDQTHNPGGSYCADFYNLFAQDGDTQGAEVLRADRKWINELKVTGPTTDPAEIGTWDSRLSEAWGLLVEKAYDHGDLLSEPIPLFSGAFYAQKQAMTWTKPMLVLIDELAGSCGDMFPMLVRANHRAKMFGQNTMGLGGNVEEVGILANSRVTVKLTRGMFYPYRADRAPTQDEFIENHGIAPDYVYNHTVSDLRAGYFTYVKSFSDKALEQISPQ